jgi:hypothetical protein
MSMTLAFFAASWDEIGAAVGSRDRKLFRSVLKELEEDLAEEYDADDFDDGPDFEVGLERWIAGAVEAKEEEEDTLQVMHLGEALAFVGLVKHFGRRAGGLVHSAEGGSLFRDTFLAEVAAKGLLARWPMEFLLSRPVGGYASADFPFWGGLRAPELAEVAGRLRADPPTCPDDPAVDEWLRDLWDALGSVLDLGTDLVSVYD